MRFGQRGVVLGPLSATFVQREVLHALLGLEGREVGPEGPNLSDQSMVTSVDKLLLEAMVLGDGQAVNMKMTVEMYTM